VGEDQVVRGNGVTGGIESLRFYVVQEAVVIKSLLNRLQDPLSMLEKSDGLGAEQHARDLIKAAFRVILEEAGERPAAPVLPGCVSVPTFSLLCSHRYFAEYQARLIFRERQFDLLHMVVGVIEFVGCKSFLKLFYTLFYIVVEFFLWWISRLFKQHGLFLRLFLKVKLIDES